MCNTVQTHYKVHRQKYEVESNVVNVELIWPGVEVGAKTSPPVPGDVPTIVYQPTPLGCETVGGTEDRYEHGNGSKTGHVPRHHRGDHPCRRDRFVDWIHGILATIRNEVDREVSQAEWKSAMRHNLHLCDQWSTASRKTQTLPRRYLTV